MRRRLAALLCAALALPGGLAAAGGLPRSETAPREADGRGPAEGGAASPLAAPSPAGRPAPASAPPPPDPAARLLAGDDAAEHWDLAAHFASGHRIYARFLITNQGPGERTAVALGQVVMPDGEVASFQNGRREDRWRISADRRHLEIGSSELHFDDGERRMVIDNQKRHFELSLAIPVDGSGRRAPPFASAARLDLLNLASPVRGRLRVGSDGDAVALEGRAVLTHAWSDRDERDDLLRRIDVATFRGDRDLFLSEWRSASDRRWQWVVLAVRDGADAPPGPFTLELRSDEAGGEGYPIPRSLELRGKRINGTITLGGPRVLEIDPLDALPSVLKLVYSFGSPRHVWLDASLDVTVREEPPGNAASAGASGEATGTTNTTSARPAANATDPRPSEAPRRRIELQGSALASVFFLDSVPPGRF